MTRTIFELADEALAPVLRAVPDRAHPAWYFRPDAEIELMALAKGSASDPDNLGEVAERYAGWSAAMSAAGMLNKNGRLNVAGQAVLGALFHFRFRVVCVGVFDELEHPLDLRLYADGQDVFLLRYHHNGAMRFSYGPLDELSRSLGKMIPERKPGSGPTTAMDLDADGKIPPERDVELSRIQQSLALPRLGTVNFDIAMGDSVFVEHPNRTFAWVDNDEGRYLLSSQWHGGAWQLVYRPAGIEEFQVLVQTLVGQLDDE